MANQHPSPLPGRGAGGEGRAFNIRLANEKDFPRIAELIGLNRSDPYTLETLIDFEAQFPDGECKRSLVIEADGEVRSWGRAMHWPQDEPSRFKFHIATLPSDRKRGYGSAIFEALLDDRMTDLRADVRDNDPDSLRFAEGLGFSKTRHMYEARLHLESVALDRLWQAIERAEANGVRFFTFAETAMDEEATRWLWQVNSISNLDQPDSDETKPTFDEFCSLVTKSTWFDPEGQILAAVGDEWVGLGAVGTFSPGCFYNLYTGVLRSHRRLGIATALKALGIRYAQSRGGTSLRTNNNAANLPMIAINDRLGFQSLPGWYALQKLIPTSPLSPPGERGRG